MDVIVLTDGEIALFQGSVLRRDRISSKQKAVLTTSTWNFAI